jgi:MSHA biogenesis protein MshI
MAYSSDPHDRCNTGVTGCEVLSLFKRAQVIGLRAGVAIAAGSLSVAVVRQREGARPGLLQCVLHRPPDSSSADALLPEIIRKAHLTRAALSAVIGTDDYHLVMAEAPDVQPSELRAAIRWRLQELIDFSVDEATVDVFEIPETPRRGSAKTLFVVAARTAAVQRLGSVLGRHARGFDVIDVPELCLRNLSGLLPQDEKGVALLMLREEFGQLVLTRQGVLYLARRIEVGRRSTLSLGDEVGAVDVDTGSVALELQRSLDYYESHYDQTPIRDLVIAPDNERARAIADALRSETGLRVSMFNCRESLDVPDGVSVPTDWLSLTTVGAALRAQATKS